MFRKISRYYYTLKHLKPIQVRYQLWYRLRSRFYPVRYPQEAKAPKFQKVTFASFPNQHKHYLGNNQFQFLNVAQSFKNEIDWNYLGQGKLWAYHLNYFEYLHQDEMDWETGMALIESFLENPADRKEGMDPYPISLRTMNWIKFLSKHNRYPGQIVDSLYAQYQVLTKKIEYHLLGNHLLENGCSLLFGAVFFKDHELKTLAQRILLTELEEQILEDGGHFERSPMYHSVLLLRLLDCINLLSHNSPDEDYLLQELRRYAAKMLGWLHAVRFKDGTLPAVNDTARGSTPDTDTLNEYGTRLTVTAKPSTLDDSGYRKVENNEWELFFDAGKIGPDHLPAHSHCDTLSFVLHYKQKPIIVDPGISTYKNNERRLWERSTSAHNTVQPDNLEQSEVWSAFRVGRKANAMIVKSSEGVFIAFHDGFRHKGLEHSRCWNWNPEGIKIKDSLEGKRSKQTKAFLHFHPACQPVKKVNSIMVHDLVFTFRGHSEIKLEPYLFCHDFNQLQESIKATIVFENQLATDIRKRLQ